MTTSAERRTGTAEVLSPAELGKRTHAVITDIATRLQGVPEFGDAVRKAFFDRSNDEGVKHTDVYFKKGDYGYNVRFRAKPRRFAPDLIQDYNADMYLIIMKYEYQPKLLMPKIIGEVSLATEFTENQDGNISKFRNGRAYIGNRVEEGSRDAAALEKVQEFLGDLLAPVKL